MDQTRAASATPAGRTRGVESKRLTSQRAVHRPGLGLGPHPRGHPLRGVVGGRPRHHVTRALRQ
jgi:hypothetical protein